jgi:hypothetical protein
MTDILVNEIVRGVLSYAGPAASIAQNVFFWEVQTANCTPSTLLSELGEWFEDNWLTEWAAMADSNANAFLLELDVLNGDGTVNRNIGSYDLDVDGLVAGDQMPAAVAGYMQADSERTGSRGRKFVPFISADNAADGAWGAGTLANLADLLAMLVESVTINLLSDLVPGILSRVDESFYEFIGSGYATNIPAYQRRRKPNVGS